MDMPCLGHGRHTTTMAGIDCKGMRERLREKGGGGGSTMSPVHTYLNTVLSIKTGTDKTGSMAITNYNIELCA